MTEPQLLLPSPSVVLRFSPSLSIFFWLCKSLSVQWNWKYLTDRDACKKKKKKKSSQKHPQSHFKAQRQNILNRLWTLVCKYKESESQKKGQEEKHFRCRLTMNVLFMQAAPKYRSKTVSFIHQHTHTHTQAKTKKQNIPLRLCF